jgi:hypothetical protein
MNDPTLVRRILDKAIAQEAHLFRKRVVEAFDSSGASNKVVWAPNKESTAKIKGSSKPLVDRADLRNSIEVQKVKNDEYFVGVPKGARGAKGQDLVDVGGVHEEGKKIAITVTPKMHRYVMALLKQHGVPPSNSGSGKFAPGSTIVISIPARSFLQSTADAHFTQEKVDRRMQARMLRMLRREGLIPAATKRVKKT